MPWKSIEVSFKKLAAALFGGALIWAFFSDSLISLLGKVVTDKELEIIRGVNNVLLLGVTAFIFYRQVRKHQRRLVLSEKQYRNLFDSNPNPMWIYDKQTLAFIAVNEAAVVKYGFSMDEFRKMTIKDIRPSSDHALLEEAIKDGRCGLKEAGMWKHIRKSGEVFPVSIVSHDVLFNQQSCRMVMVTDISIVVRNEEMLLEAYLKEKELREELSANYDRIRKSEEENRVMAQVINKINNLVLVVEENCAISWANKAFKDFTGYSSTEVNGKKADEILFGAATAPETIERLLQSIRDKTFFSEELINYKKTGEPYWTQLTISPIYDEKGDFRFSMFVETVITERKEKEQRIMVQHAALQKIAWSNSHELRRPVCLILGLISILKDAKDEKEKGDCMSALEVCTQELDELVKGINKKIDELELEVNNV